MINLYNKINELSCQLDQFCKARTLKDYRIFVKVDNRIFVYLIDIAKDELTLLHNTFSDENYVFEEIDEDDSFANSFYFSQKEKINILDTSKNLTQILGSDESFTCREQTPIITFYSYKGGVGRSTTLASFAAYYAIHLKKKVVIIDCDFEAPGFTNFFMEDACNPTNSNGVIEYLLDKDFSEKTHIRNYIWQASKNYSGEGEIYVMPSGNLDDSVLLDDGYTNREHYLFGLSRLDFSEKDSIRFQFEGLLSDLKEEISPDLILLDSRTGFNDILGLTAFHLSNIVVGFFGNSTQSMPGMHFFIDSIIKRQNLAGVLVNAIIPSMYKRKMLASFNDSVENYIDRLDINEIMNENDSDFNIEAFPITRNDILEMIGVKDEDPFNFIELITSKSFTDYNLLFDKLISLTEDFQPKLSSDLHSPDDENENKDDVDFRNEESYPTTSKVESPRILKDDGQSDLILKKAVLDKLEEKMPELYAENIDFNVEYSENRYFYRKCMLDLFNLDKFLVLGNKGTGKTYIYRSLKNKLIVKELQKRANKMDINYSFVHIVDSEKHFFDTTKFDGDDLSNFSHDKFYERFWMVYIWNVLYLSLEQKSELKLFTISDDTSTSLDFQKIINDDKLMIIVEKELRLLDSKLQEDLNRQVIIIFDELDKVVKPHIWSERISPLINLCKKFKYSRIFPKLFLRSDLFEKISNVNNIQELRNKAINIEWTQEELFAYFFKLILSHSEEEFCSLMKSYDYYPSKQVNKIIRHISENKFERNIDIDELKLCCGTFFGKYADTSNTARFGETYDWLFKNLKNANDTISLRPFIDLIQEAMNNAREGDTSDKPILPQLYFTHGNARGKAVERHFQDLAKESGNEDLAYILKYIREEASPQQKLLEINREDFLELLNDIIDKYGDRLATKSKDDLIYLLIVNGIIKERIVRTGYRNVQLRYQFALLYKYYLGLKNRSSKRRF